MKTDLEKFVESCERADFRNHDEFLQGIKTGEVVLVGYRQMRDAGRRLTEIYGHREQHLRQFQTKHSENLRQDVLEMLGRMSKAPDKNIGCWHFTKEPNIDFLVFVNADTQAVLGCLRAIDKRLTPADEWKKIWGS